SEIGRRHLAGVVREPGRTAPNRYGLGQRVEIDDAIDAGIPLLQCDELHDRAEVIAEMQIPGRLNPGKNQLIERHRAAPSIARGPCGGRATAGKGAPPHRGAVGAPLVVALPRTLRANWATTRVASTGGGDCRVGGALKALADGAKQNPHRGHAERLQAAEIE